MGSHENDSLFVFHHNIILILMNEICTTQYVTDVRLSTDYVNWNSMKTMYLFINSKIYRTTTNNLLK